MSSLGKYSGISYKKKIKIKNSRFSVWLILLRSKRAITLIRHTICESLVKIQYLGIVFCSLIMYMKIIKKRYKIKGCSITCSYIWHVINMSKCVYLLDIHFVVVWWKYVLPNTNAIYFYDIIFRHRAVLPTCPKNQTRKLKI